jgi:hypothetical protein
MPWLASGHDVEVIANQKALAAKKLTYDQLLNFAARLITELIRTLEDQSKEFDQTIPILSEQKLLHNRALEILDQYHGLLLAQPDMVANAVKIGFSFGSRVAPKKGGRTKNEPYRIAKQYLLKEWEAKKVDYGNNKSQFARDYVRLISHRFTDGDGDPLKVTEKTIREVWLKSPRAASTEAGLQVVGE